MNIFSKLVNNSSIRPQLFITVAIGFLLLLFFTIYASNWVSHQQVRQVLVKQGLQTAENLAINSRLALLYESPENAIKAVQATLAFPDVVSVSIHRLNKTVLYQSAHEHDHVLAPKLFNKLTNFKAKLVYEDKSDWQFIAPVLTTDQHEYMEEQLFKYTDSGIDELIGFVVVTSSKERLNTTRARILDSNLIIATVIGILLLAVLHITIKRLTQPLYSISETMQQAEGSGRLSSVSETGPLEVQHIAESYNKMVKSLAERDEKLRKQNDFLEYQAIHEHLTGLINRIGFEQALKLAVAECKTLQVKHVLCYMDLDKFKIVNDSCGHNAGDELLQNVSEIFKQHIRKDSDLLARVGGDEFALILKNCSIEKAGLIGAAICKDVENYRFHWEGKIFSIGVSIGIVHLDENTMNIEDAISKADSACYIAKERGRGQVYLLRMEDEELQNLSGETQIASQIIDHLENNKFELYCQWIKPLSDKIHEKKQYEILLRMKDENGKNISPVKFLSSAERYDLMTRIDRWVVSRVLTQLSRSECFLNQLEMCTINISASSINDEYFASFIKDEFSKHNMLPECICFEITESVISRHTIKAKRFINIMHELGCRITLDDFVSNSSSFSHIKNLNINYLKIQGDFFKDILNNPVNHAMARSINEISHILQIQTIAEHIEDEESFNEVTKIGFNYAQGFFVNKPSPLSDVIEETESNHV